MKILRYLIVAIGLISISDSYGQSKIETIYKKGIVINAFKDSARTHPIFQFKPGFRFQTLFETEGNPEGNEKWESNFVIRRARLKFDGFILNPNVVYKVELSLSPNDLKSTSDFKETGGAAKIILDALLKWKFYQSKNTGHSLTLWVGQTKQPGNRQRLVSSQSMQLVDRSEVNSTFNIDRDLGIQLHGQFKAGSVILRPIFAIAKGEGRNVISKNIGGFSYTGKLEILPLGAFSDKGDYFEADLSRESKPKLSLAASANYNHGASRQTQTGVFLKDTADEYMTNNLLTVFADVMFKYKGFSLLGEYGFKQIMLKSGQSLSATDSTIVSVDGKSYRTGYGVSVQAGYLFKHNIELVARYSKVVPDWTKSFTGSQEYTLGLSKYFVGHKLKVQTDATLVDPDMSADYTINYRLQLEVAF